MSSVLLAGGWIGRSPDHNPDSWVAQPLRMLSDNSHPSTWMWLIRLGCEPAFLCSSLNSFSELWELRSRLDKKVKSCSRLRALRVLLNSCFCGRYSRQNRLSGFPGLPAAFQHLYAVRQSSKVEDELLPGLYS